MTVRTPIHDLIGRMERMLAEFVAAGDPQAYFLATYLRTTQAVAHDLAAGRFLDVEWTEQWDIAFAGRYLDAVDRWQSEGRAPGPWLVAFARSDDEPRIPPLRHVLLGMNAHINFDLPQSLLDVITDDEFADAPVVARRRTDHEHIDEILASRVRDEDRELRKVELPGDRTVADRLLTPFNRRATRQFLKEARTKVWHNAQVLSRARRQGTLEQRITELEQLAAKRVTDLRAPGLVVLRLARDGFGVVLPSGHPAAP